MRTGPSGVARVGRVRSKIEAEVRADPPRRDQWYVIAAITGSLSWLALTVWLFW